MKTSLVQPPELNLVATSVELAAESTVAGEAPSPRRFSMVAYTGGPSQLSGLRYPVVVEEFAIRR